MTETTPSKLGCLSFYHPLAQERVLALAVMAGADLWRPAQAVGVEAGYQPAVSVSFRRQRNRIRTQLQLSHRLGMGGNHIDASNRSESAHHLPLLAGSLYSTSCRTLSVFSGQQSSVDELAALKVGLIVATSSSIVRAATARDVPSALVPCRLPTSRHSFFEICRGSRRSHGLWT